MEDKKCYTVAELQDILRISRGAVYRLLQRKEFKWIMIGTTYRIPKAGFDEWIDKMPLNEE